MEIVFCGPNITMKNTKDATIFFETCRSILDQYVSGVKYITNDRLLMQFTDKKYKNEDILIFFNSEDGIYNANIIRLFKAFCKSGSYIWPIAMEPTSSCRKPPKQVSQYQSFDVHCVNENRNPLRNNIRAIAGVFTRKLMSYVLSPMYRDDVMYFISHKRSDGEHIASRIADELRCLIRERKVFRDVVNVEVGNDAQKEIDEKLKISDVVIFIQTPEAGQSDYIIKELTYALVEGIPVLWIQIDDAPISDLAIRPGDKPALSYKSFEFDNRDRLISIAEEIEDNCFQIMMNSSNYVYTYIEYLQNMKEKKEIDFVGIGESILEYQITYHQETKDIYENAEHTNYIQCFGRRPAENDINNFKEKVAFNGSCDQYDRTFLLSDHGEQVEIDNHNKIFCDNYDNYIINLETLCGITHPLRNKRIILSGAFPDCDEIYKTSLLEALRIYSREIIRNGYILVFGAHPTFQEIIFENGRKYSDDATKSIEMYMDRAYTDQYDLEELEGKCNLFLSDDLREMRKQMICNQSAEMMICMGGKIKDNKSEQGLDEEIELAKNAGIPVALVGTVGGRSSEYAYEILRNNTWNELNAWGTELNEDLFYKVNHRLMIRKLLDELEDSDSRTE